MSEDMKTNGGEPALEVRSVSKYFGSVNALEDVSLAVYAGQVTCVLGDNGAGKSTLIKILSGVHVPDQGEVLFEGEPVSFAGPRDARGRGIATVFQDLATVPLMSVWRNFFLGNEPTRGRGPLQRVDIKGAQRIMRAEMAKMGIDVRDPDQTVGTLSGGERQAMAIARAVYFGAKVLILDEPTSALEANAVERLFERIRRVKESGVAILYISHHLEEVYEICDRATVLRDGRRIVTAPVTALDQEQLVTAMVGGELARAMRNQTPQADDVEGSPRLRIRGVSVQTPLGSVEDVSLAVHAGECVGLFGLRGSGSVAIADAVAGLVSPSAGAIELDGKRLRTGRADAALRRGVGYVPEDRHARGFVPTLGVAENLTLPILERLSRWGFISGGRQRAAAAALAERLQIVASSGDQPVAELSGGNQQKVVVGRALAAQPSLLVVVSPTVGIDVASKEALLGVIDNAREEGAAVLLVSDDLDELRICTRVLVVRRGAIVKEFREAPWDRLELIAAAEGMEVAA